MNEAREKAFNGALLLHGADYGTVILDEDDCRKIVEAVLAVKPEPVFEWRNHPDYERVKECFVNGKEVGSIEFLPKSLRIVGDLKAFSVMTFNSEDNDMLFAESETEAKAAVESEFREWLNGIY